MKHLIPGRVDLILFVGMALVCGMVVSFSPSRDYMLGVLTMPIFLFASLRGLRQSRVVARVEADLESGEASTD